MSLQWLNYHHLYYFYVIAAEGSVGGATRKLKLAQSTLSTQLKRFEEVIGYNLFQRKNRRLELTDVGKRVYEYAHEIFSLGDELRDSLGNFQESLNLSLKVGVMDSIPKKLCRDLVEIVCSQNNARVTIFEESLSSLCSMLSSHDIDLIIANDKPPIDGKDSRFHARLIGELKVIFVADAKRAHLREGMPQSLDHQPMVMPGFHSPLRREIMEHLKIKHVMPKVVAEVDDLELQKMLVMDGLGFSAFPEISVIEELRSGDLISLSDTPFCHENLWLITSHRLVHHPLTRLLMDSFRPTH